MRNVTSEYLTTSRLKIHYLKTKEDAEVNIFFIHGNASSSIFWKNLLQQLPKAYNGYALDLRGFGDTEDKIIDATRGMGDFCDDIISFLEAQGIEKAHFVGHSMGGSAVVYLSAQHPDAVLSLTLVNPGSPFGFGGTKDLNGTPHFDDFAGSGAGVVNLSFAERISKGDRSEEDPIASPRVVMNTFYWKPPFRPPNEEELLTGLLSEKIGPDKYPGDSESSENWPYVMPGVFGPANALSPKYIGNTVEKFITNQHKFPVLWIRGDSDQIVSDQSLFDLGTLGKLGAIPEYPGETVYPSQPMVSQMRKVLQERFETVQAPFKEIVIEDAGHTPFIEKEEEFCTYFFNFLQNGL